MMLGEEIQVKLTLRGVEIYDRECLCSLPIRQRGWLLAQLAEDDNRVRMKLAEFCSIFGAHLERDKPIIVGGLERVEK